MKIQRCWKIFSLFTGLFLGSLGPLQAADEATPYVWTPNTPINLQRVKAPETPLTRTFRFKIVKAEEARIVLLGTLLANPPHLTGAKVNDSDNSLTLTDTYQNLEHVEHVLPIIDRPLQSDQTQYRLMELWVRIAAFYNAEKH